LTALDYIRLPNNLLTHLGQSTHHRVTNGQADREGDAALSGTTDTTHALDLTPQEFAAEKRINYRTALALIRSGEIPAYRIGRQYRIPRAALETLRTDVR
jgi:excisionase family DNA binding protein